MNLEDIELNFQKLGLGYRIFKGVDNAELRFHESRLGIVFPDQVKLFYQANNGISVTNPPFEIFDIGSMLRDKSLIAFCKLNGVQTLSFDVSSLNDAGQWSIVNAETGYEVTKTMASFWANKMMAWLRKEREVWKHEKYS